MKKLVTQYSYGDKCYSIFDDGTCEVSKETRPLEIKRIMKAPEDCSNTGLRIKALQLLDEANKLLKR